MKIEDLTKEEIKKCVGLIRDYNQTPVMQQALDGNHLNQQLESFYELSYYKRPIRMPRIGGIGIIPNSGFEDKKEDSEKTGQVPTSLIQILDEFNQEKIIGRIVPDINELSYENVRDAIDGSSYYPLSEKILVRTAGSVGLFSLFSSMLFEKSNFLEFVLGAGLMIYGFTKNNYNYANKPRNVINREKAFLNLHENSRKIDTVIDNYKLFK